MANFGRDRAFDDEFEFDLRDLDELNSNFDSDSEDYENPDNHRDEEGALPNRIIVARRMAPFYALRTDVFDRFFDDHQLYKTF